MKLRTTHSVLEEAASAVKRYSINEISFSPDNISDIDHETDMIIFGPYPSTGPPAFTVRDDK